MRKYIRWFLLWTKDCDALAFRMHSLSYVQRIVKRLNASEKQPSKIRGPRELQYRDEYEEIRLNLPHMRVGSCAGYKITQDTSTKSAGFHTKSK